MGCLRESARGVVVVSVLLAGSLWLASCAATDSSSSGQSGAGAASPAPSASWTGPPLSAADARAVRGRAFAYWDAYNDYDPETAISYLDEGYRPAQAPVVRDDVGRIKTFGVKLGMTEKTAPVAIGSGQAEMYLSMKTPTGVRTILMRFVKRADVWAITFVEEVP
jgi:hypothetical protein